VARSTACSRNGRRRGAWIDACNLARGMWERLVALPMMMMGAVLTQACARVGLCWLLAIASGPRSPPPKTPATWTLSIPTTTRNVNEMVALVRAFRSEVSPIAIETSGRTLHIAGAPAEVERLAHIVREIDQPATAGQRIWTVRVRGSAGALAQALDMLSTRRHCWPAGARVSKVIPDDATHRVIVVADAEGYRRLTQQRHDDDCFATHDRCGGRTGS
jgi:hypothetical protein